MARTKPYGPPYVQHEEYARIADAMRKELNEGPGKHRKLLVKRWLISQERLNVLAEHNDAQVELGDRPPLVRQVTVEIRTDDGRVGRAVVTALGPLQGRAEAYTPETVPTQVGGAEKTSEGVSGVDAHASDKETIKP